MPEREAVLISVKGNKRVVCEKHGDIGTADGLAGNTAVCFTLNETSRHFCLQCIGELLLEHIAPCKIEDSNAA